MQQSKWPLLAPVILGALILGCGGAGTTVTPDPDPDPPVITGNPSSLTVFEGDAAAFTVTATGPNLTYQWLRNGTPITGATSATYSIAAAQSSDAGSYVARVTNADGAANSTAATLTVRPNTGGAGVIVD
ncbi:MAG: immunoglobulin domain-containing protein [Fimbriimonadaceae bacterium]|nr:immunoglobulin domain-containing protein [Fimbriimonadaceae bacterium]